MYILSPKNLIGIRFRFDSMDSVPNEKCTITRKKGLVDLPPVAVFNDYKLQEVGNARV